MKKIDAHSHIGSFGGWAGVAFTAEKLLEQMDEYEIEKPFSPARPSGTTTRWPRRSTNTRTRSCPLYGLIPVLDNVPEKLHHYVCDEGFMGIKMQPLFDSFVADDPVVYPVMDFAREHKIPVFIHCGHPPYSLPWSIALLAEQYPDVPVTMIHMGHGHGVYIDASIKMAKRYPNLYLEMSGMPMGCKIAEAYKTVGTDRIMFGIDSPFHHPSVEIQKVLTSGLTEKEQEDVFYNNAKKLLKL